VGQWLSAPYGIFGQTTTKARKLTAALWGMNFSSVLSRALVQSWQVLDNREHGSGGKG
jgi:hypothetical protein